MAKKKKKSEAKGLELVNEKIEEMESDKVELEQAASKAKLFTDLKSYLYSCYQSSVQWRKSSHEENWDNFHRNARSVYDPTIKSKKKKWQITMFVPLTIKHKERVKSQVFRTLMGSKPHFEIEPRSTGGNPDQAKSLKDIVMYFMDKANFALKFNDQVDQGTTYGSGFSKLYWMTKTEKRKVREPIREGSEKGIMQQIQEFFMTGHLPRTVKYEEKIKDVETFRGVVYDWVDIHDMFPDPGDPTFKESWVFHRTPMKYGEMVKGANAGYFFKDAVERLKNVNPGEPKPEDKQEEKADREEADVSIKRTDFEVSHQVCEFWGRLPRKHIYPNKTFGEEEGNEIIPAKAIMTENGQEVLSVEENSSYDGKNIFNKLDYIRIAGLHYGMGVPELLWGLQEEINELRNQRVDNGTLRMNLLLAVMEDALVDGDDLMSQAGGVIRIARRRYDDVRKAISKIELGRQDPSNYQETLEIEKEAQETTGVGRITLGTGGQFAKDVNQTARGMQLLKQASLELLSYYTSLMELSAFVNIIRDFYILIYQNVTMDELRLILGPERAMKFELLPVEEVEKFYKFKPTGTFTMESRLQKAQSHMAFKQAYEGAPFIKQLPLARRIARLLEIDDPDEILATEEEMQKAMQGQLQAGGGDPTGQRKESSPGGPGMSQRSPGSKSMGGLDQSLESPL